MPDYGRLVRLAIQPLALGLIFALSAATLARLLGWPKLLLRRSGAGSHSLHYEDQDGAASEESTKAYSDLGPRLAAWASVTVGLSSSIASVILSQHPHSWTAAVKPDSPLSVVVPWLDVIGWVGVPSGFPAELRADHRGFRHWFACNVRFYLSKVNITSSSALSPLHCCPAC